METGNNQPIRFAIVGFGHIGRRHAEEISANSNTILCAIADTDSNAALLAKGQYDVPVYTKLSDLLDYHQDIDVVNICTPNGLHISIAKQSVQAGFNVLVEKPMGLLKKDCDSLLELASKMNKRVFCVLQNRYSPPSQFINKMILNQSLGKIYRVAINCFWNRDKRYYQAGSWRGTSDLDGGPLYTQFSHFIDLLYWNFGPVTNIDARFYNYNHSYLPGIEDTGMFSFDFINGGSGTFSWSTALHQTNLESSIVIIGEKGTIKAGGQYMEKIDFFNVEGMEFPGIEKSMPPNHYGAWQGSAANHAFVIENVVKALRSQPFEMATVDEAIATVNIIEQVYNLRTFKVDL